MKAWDLSHSLRCYGSRNNSASPLNCPMTPQKITDAPLPHLLYNPDAIENVPLVLFLHGSGERGNDLERVATVGLPHLLANLPPAFVAAPQCPESARWTDHLEGLEALLDDLLARYPVDPKRAYLTGLSLGGEGAWFWAARNPERFAGVVPICGRTDPEHAERLKSVPIWAFHGAEDGVVPPGESEKMVEALRAAGGHVKLTVLGGVGHDSWTPAYRDPELYRWLFAQRRG